MNTTTWTTSPADLLGLGATAMRPCTDLGLRRDSGVSPAPDGAQVRAAGMPAGTAARLRPVGRTAFAHNFIGTTLGSHPSRRPQS